MAHRAHPGCDAARDPGADRGFRVRGSGVARVLTTLFFALLHVPHFPTGTMLAVSIGFALILVLYEGLIRVLSD